MLFILLMYLLFIFQLANCSQKDSSNSQLVEDLLILSTAASLSERNLDDLATVAEKTRKSPTFRQEDGRGIRSNVAAVKKIPLQGHMRRPTVSPRVDFFRSDLPKKMKKVSVPHSKKELKRRKHRGVKKKQKSSAQAFTCVLACTIQRKNTFKNFESLAEHTRAYHRKEVELSGLTAPQFIKSFLGMK